MHKGKITWQDKEQWYKSHYEEQKSPMEIAAKEKCDTRTVKKGLEQVRNAKNADAAELELVKSAINMHQADLMDAIRRIKTAAELPDISSAPVGWAEDDELEKKIKGRQAELESMGSVPIQERIGNEYNVKLDLLGQHLRGETLWRLFSAWTKAWYKLENARLELQAFLVRLIREEFHLRPYETEPYVFTKSLCPLYYRGAVAKATGKPIDKILEMELTQAASLFGTGGSMKPSEKKSAKYAALLDKVWEDLVFSDEEHKLASSYVKLKDVTAKIAREAEEYLLSHYVSGKCRVCKKYRR
ncbi:MAG: hypothetical protein ABR886_02555 [Dehalococcoidales bacterium]|jgi:hypothetical protein